MEHSPKGTSVGTGRVAALAGRAAHAALGAGGQELGPRGPKGRRSSPRSTHPARPAPPRVERATPGLPRRPQSPPHASPLSARRSWICVGRGKARLPFMAESAADSRGGRASGAGGRASGSRPPPPQPGRGGARRSLRRGRRSGRARAGWGRGGGGRRGAGSPVLGSASDCGAAGRCVITMARSLCPGAWLRKPYYLQVGRRRARWAPSPAVRDSPAFFLPP